MSKAFPKTALLCVSDKTGIIEFAHGLQEAGYALLTAGQTSSTLREAGLEVRDIRDLTEAPELLEGRLRLLHPRLFAGLHADRASGDEMRTLDREKIPAIDLVAANLYPIANVLEDENANPDDLLEFLDIGGTALLRAAARNFKHIITLCDPADYPSALNAIKTGKNLSIDRSRALAAKAYFYTAYYDSTVAQYLSQSREKMPEELVVGLKKAADLHYGENPQQGAALYTRSGARPWGLQAAQLAAGKPLSFAHYVSLDRAAELVAEFQEPACAITVHAHPAGAAIGATASDAARSAYRSDPEGCSGGVVALNREIDAKAAEVLAAEYIEVVAAPEFSEKALAILKVKKDLRLVRLPPLLLSANETEMRTLSGGVILQDADHPLELDRHKVVTQRQPTDAEALALTLAWRVAKHALTHAAVIASAATTLGIGGGQSTRLDAIRLAIVKSQQRHPVVTPGVPTVLATDGAIGPQHLQEAADAGIGAIIGPGGTSEDRDTVRAANDLGLAMIFTGVRHYRH
jgi:phosphoribosylaminoimidazolecarboxamide formyltransferase/IMP cyclohydrolase